MRTPRILTAFALALLASLSFAGLAEATDPTHSTNSTNVTGTNAAKLTLSLSTPPNPAFPNDMAFDGGHTSHAGNDHFTAGDGNSTWYVAAPSVTVTVKSNKSWSGNVEASPNAGSSPSGQTVNSTSGDFAYYTSTAPMNYTEANGGTLFFSTNESTNGNIWASSIAKGATPTTFFYGLNVDVSDDPGNFSSTVTYCASQAGACNPV